MEVKQNHGRRICLENGIQSLHMGCAVTLLVALLLFLGMLAIGRFQQWRWRGRTEGAEVAIRATETHTQEELQQAVNVVLEEFEAFYGCTLNRLWYDEAIAAPLEQEQAKARELEDGDVLVLLADFQSGKSATILGLNPTPTMWTTVSCWFGMETAGGAFTARR